MSGAFIQIACTVLSACLLSPWMCAVPRWVFQSAAAVLLWPLWRNRGKPVFLPAFLCGLFCLTVSSWQLDRLWPVDSVHFWRGGERVNLEGLVVSPPEIIRQGKRLRVSFVLKTESRVFFDGEVKRKSPVTGNIQVRLYQCERIPSYGDAVLVSGQLAEPPAQRNLFGFDERRRLAERGLDSVLKGYGAKSAVILGKSPERSRILERIFELRDLLRRRIEKIWEPGPAGYFKALVVGERGEVPAADREAFIRTATAHILSISGLHFTLISGTFFLLLTALGVRRRAAAFVSVLFLAVYVFLAGASIPVVRSGVMACLVMAALLLERESRAIHLFCFALSAFLLTDSRVLTSVSFQLSFLSVFCLIVFCRNSHGSTQMFAEGVKTSAVVAAGTFPVTAAVFHGFSLSGIPANIAAVPLFNSALLFALLALAVSPIPLAGPLAVWAADFLLQSGLAAVRFFSAIPGSYLPVPFPAAWKIAAYTLFGVLAVIQQVSHQSVLKRLRWMILSGWFLCGLSFFIPAAKSQAASFTLFETRAYPLLLASFEPSQKWLFLRMNSRFQAEENWLLRPYLQGQGIGRLQGAVSIEKGSGRKASPVSSLGGVPVEMFKQASSRADSSGNSNLGEGARVRFTKTGGGFQILGFVKGKALLHFWAQGCEALMIPVLNAETVMILHRQRALIEDSEVLILPGLTAVSREYLEKLLLFLDPSVVILPDLDHWPETLKTKRVMSQKETGGIHFKIEDKKLLFETHAGRETPLTGARAAR